MYIYKLLFSIIDDGFGIRSLGIMDQPPPATAASKDILCTIITLMTTNQNRLNTDFGFYFHKLQSYTLCNCI